MLKRQIGAAGNLPGTVNNLLTVRTNWQRLCHHVVYDVHTA